MISVALISRWHAHADDYAKSAQDNPRITIKKVWDEIPERGQQWAKELGVSYESDLSAILSDPSIDAVIVNAPTRMHKDIMIDAAKNKKHIFSEKVLAITLDECDQIFSAIENSGVKWMLSLPFLTEPYYLYAQDVLHRGLLGKLTSIRCRLAHDGAIPSKERPYGWVPEGFFSPEISGGGALIDLGAHPIYLTNRLVGPAKAVTARLTTIYGFEVDDNAAALVEYESGVLGILEASFVSSNSFLLELHGTEGILMMENGKTRIRSKHIKEEGWVVPTDIPERLLMPMEQWVSEIIDGTKTSITKEDAWRLTQINQAAAISHKEGRRIELTKM